MEIYNSLETPASKEFQELLNSQISKTKNLTEGKVIEGKVTNNIEYLSASVEANFTIATANSLIDKDGHFTEELVSCRK